MGGHGVIFWAGSQAFMGSQGSIGDHAIMAVGVI